MDQELAVATEVLNLIPAIVFSSDIHKGNIFILFQIKPPPSIISAPAM
jgi:hypothetical protein